MAFSSSLYKHKVPEYFFNERADMLHFVPDGVKTVLDVGCSSGGFGKLIKEKFDCQVWGVEPTSAAIEAAKHLDKVYQDFFHEGLNFGSTKFDLIIFNDVLEHLVDPWAALELSKRYLDYGGYVLASIPNIQCYTVVKDLILNGKWSYTSSGILDKTHLRFFTGKSIAEMFESTGYEIYRFEGMHSVLPYSRFLRLLKTLVPRRVKPFTFTSYGVVAKLVY